jgi:4-hydroxybenzoate polyprenyltransferase
MAVSILVIVVCFVAGTWASSRWLPDLDSGQLGAIAFFVVCGLCGAVLAIIGVDIDAIVRETRHTSGEISGEIIAARLAAMLRDSGTVAGLALIVYVLAPRPSRNATLSAVQATQAGSSEL